MATEGGGASAPSTGAGHNQDAYLVHDGLGLYVVADGSSDGPAGEIAARIAVEALEAFVGRSERPSLRFIFRSFPSKGFAFDALRYALGKVVAESGHRVELAGMRTTVTMLMVHQRQAVAGYVGDSRLYLMRAGHVFQLTEDHDLTLGPDRASGGEPIQCFALDVHADDRFLICTDGAGDVLTDPQLRVWVTDLHPRHAAASIVRVAQRLDPGSDATVVVVRVLPDDERGWLELSVPAESWEYGHTLSYA